MGRLAMAGALTWFGWAAALPAWALVPAPEPKAQKPVFQSIFSLVMVGLVCAVAFKNPKRSHQS